MRGLPPHRRAVGAPPHVPGLRAVGCCDSSPNRHATAHWQVSDHPLIRSCEPGEDWWWCYVDELGFEVDDAEPAPSHP